MANNGTIVSDNASVAYSRQAQALYVLDKAQHSNPVYKQEAVVGATTAEVYGWGEDNLTPQHIIADSRKNTIIPSTLSWKAEALYGAGVGFGYVEYKGDKEVLVPQEDKYPQIKAFIGSRKMRRYLRQSSKAYYWFKNTFPELILSKDRKQIVSIASQRPEYCRYKKEKDNSVKRVVLNTDWLSYDPKLDISVDLIDPYQDDDVAWLRAQKGHKYIYPVCDPTPGTTYYQEAEWHSVRQSGWLKIVEEIPKFKKALFENQISPKYLIEVSTWWWEWKYNGFNDFPAERKKQLMQEELDRFESFMVGSANAGNSLMVTFHSNPEAQKEYAGWKVTSIKNDVPEGIYNADSQEGNSHIMYALGVDPVLRGFTPGAKMASGGSEKRVAWNNHLLVTKPHQDDILEPLEFIRDYNGWDPRLKFWFKNYYQATLDVAKEPQQMTS